LGKKLEQEGRHKRKKCNHDRVIGGEIFELQERGEEGRNEKKKEKRIMNWGCKKKNLAKGREGARLKV